MGHCSAIAMGLTSLDDIEQVGENETAYWILHIEYMQNPVKPITILNVHGNHLTRLMNIGLHFHLYDMINFTFLLCINMHMHDDDDVQINRTKCLCKFITGNIIISRSMSMQF